MNRNKRMLKTTLIYLIGTFSSKILTFILLPVYTNNLNLDEYGIVNLVTNIVPLIGPIFTLQITDSIFRFLCNNKNNHNKKISVTNSFLILCIGFITFTLLYIPICILIKFNYFWLFYLYFIFNYFGIYTQQLLRGENKNIDYAITGVLATLIQLSINILLITRIKENSILLGLLVSSLAITLYGMARVRIFKLIDLKLISKEEIKKQISYSIPLIPNQICWWFNGVAGLYIVKYFLGGDMTGIISFANKFPSLIATINGIYFLAWTENSIYEYDSMDRDEFYSKNLKGFILFQLIILSLTIVFVKMYSLLTISSNYHLSLYIIPILFIAMFFNAIATFLGTIYTASMKTKEALKTTIVAGISNIVCSIILIPLIGIYGFALSNVISYILLLLVRIKSVNRIVSLKIDKIRDFIIPSILAIITIFIYYFINLMACIIYEIIILIIILILYRKIIKKISKKILKRVGVK